MVIAAGLVMSKDVGKFLGAEKKVEIKKKKTREQIMKYSKFDTRQ